MRLLKQISLDGHSPINHHSANFHSFRFHYHVGTNHKLNNDFGKHLAEILDRNVRLLNLINQIGKNDGSLLKALESLNACIVTLIEMCEFTKSLQSTNINNMETKDFALNSNGEKQKFKLRRHYSAFVDGGQLFRGKRPSLQLPNGINEKDHTLVANESIYIENIIENSIHKLIESNILNILVDSIPDIGFEEKKLARVILTNSLTISVKNNKIIVEYFCDSSNQILQSLVKSYEYGKSDVTLNCGCILRFAAQFEPIIFKILQSDYFHNFFDYMRQSSSDYPFDVAMDVFYTFKTLMSKHKKSTTEILVADSNNFFDSLIKLLEHAELTEDYVTKRQTLEVLTEIFSGHERFDLREKFIIHQNFIYSVIRYLWNRNLQIRLRCLALISQFTQYPLSTLFSWDEEENDEENVTITNMDNYSSSESSRMDRLIDKIKTTFIEAYPNNQYPNNEDSNIDSQIKKNLNELKNECQKSNVKNFEQLVCFVDQLIKFIDCN